MTGKVLNVTDCPGGWRNDPAYIYIGRSSAYGRDVWGNPYTVGVEGMSRDEVLSLYVAWLKEQVNGNTSFPHRLYGLYGKNLVCHCAPAPCHGDFLLRLTNRLKAFEVKYGRKPEDFSDISVFGDQARLACMRDEMKAITLDHGRRIRGEMRAAAEQAARDELGKETDDPLVEWRAFRKRWLDPLLRYELPTYRAPLGQGG